MFELELHSWKDVRAVFARGFKRAWRDVRAWKSAWIISLTVGVVFGVYFQNGDAFFLWTLFLLFLLYRWDNRILGAIAILLLTSCPILLSIKQDLWAESMAIYEYYFLVMTVVLQIVEFKRDQKKANIPAKIPKQKGILDLRPPIRRLNLQHHRQLRQVKPTR